MSFRRLGSGKKDVAICVFNLTPVVRHSYRVRVPSAKSYRVVLDTDATCYGGNGAGQTGLIEIQATRAHGLDNSIELTLPPLAAAVLMPN